MKICLNRRSFLYFAGCTGIGLATPDLIPDASGAEGSALSGQPLADANGDRVAGSTAWLYRPYQSRTVDKSEASTWVQIDLGSTQPIQTVQLFPAHVVLSPGDGFPARFRVECSDNVDFRNKQLIADRSVEDYPDPADQVVQFSARQVRGRYLRVTAVRLRHQKPPVGEEMPKSVAIGYYFSLSRVAVISGDRDVAVNCRVTVDSDLGSAEDAQQITRNARPQGEGVITDQPQNVTSQKEWHPVSYEVKPPRRGVHLEGGLLQSAMQNNITYLLESFSVGDLLHEFRLRAGLPVSASSQKLDSFWVEDLGGSNAGRFLMGAGNTLRWIEHSELRARMNAVIRGIAECRERNGYIMGYPEDTILVSERGGYARAWLTQGLIEAGYAGNQQAFELLRGYYDWFNRSKYLPQLLRGCIQGGQGMIANTRVYFSPVGKPADIQTVQRFFQESYWLDELAAHKPEAIWQYPYDRPHSYLLTNIEAYLDLYRATGDSRYLDAVDGAWDLFHENWENAGGIISIVENERCAPKSNKLYAELGETCGNAFWISLNHQLHCLRPSAEKYVAEIEKSIYNVMLANQDAANGYRYHTLLLGQKEHANRINTCCEGQATRIVGNLADYIYSISSDALYVNLYEPSTIEWSHSGQTMRAILRTHFPREDAVELELGFSTSRSFRVFVRIPSWVEGVVRIEINGTISASGIPGTYTMLDRRWSAGDKISLRLPMALTLSKYEGSDRIEGHERFAVSCGPFLMADVTANAPRILLLWTSGRPTDLIARLKLIPGSYCHFALEDTGNDEAMFIPYFEVTSQPFTCFPIIETRTGVWQS
jgi:uncharacterized protein